MKIKIIEKSYSEAIKQPADYIVKPKKPSFLLNTLIRILSEFELSKLKFKKELIGMDKLSKKEPCLFLMNHSSFIDGKIASKLLYPRKYNIVLTDDGFVGKKWLMQNIGCIKTRKYVPDTRIVKDMINVIKKHKSSILMFPEACYSFDGTATQIPYQLAKCIKLLGIPVVMIKTKGAFLRQPLYNNLRLRKVNVSATMKYLLSAQDINQKSIDEIFDIIKQEFSFDYFKEQLEDGVIVSDEFRAEALNRVLYKCPCCGAEGVMEGHGINLTCKKCNALWEMQEDGSLKSDTFTFTDIPSWYEWERLMVSGDVEDDDYEEDYKVDVYLQRDYKGLYKIGEGKLTQTKDGIHLKTNDGEVDFYQSNKVMYSLNTDFFFYEIGDMVCIGDEQNRFYCFPHKKDVVAKMRLVTEETFKLKKNNI